MKKELLYAWGAGIIDGEGCIYINRQPPKKGAKNYCYSAAIKVSMTHMPTVKKLHTIFGGYYHERKGQKEKDRNQATWWISSKNALIVLQKIKKFLFTKKQQARWAIEFLKLPRATDFKETPAWLLKKREELTIKIQQDKGIEFNIIQQPLIKKHLKKNQTSVCLICKTKMPQFMPNGRKKVVCSNKCKIEKQKGNQWGRRKN
jgi:hypothetical protein